MLNYRPEIDGLRAVAVLSVIIYHFFPQTLSGGFVGVDIFFVISGYLITSIIYKDAESNNFSYIDFYKRRALRIFPALIAVLFACLLYGWFNLLQGEYRLLGKHVFLGSFFVANLALLLESGYFDSASELKPLLHLWSLGVEEQFYIVWPITILLLFSNKKAGKALAILIFLVSFSYCIYSTIHNPSVSYYSPISRFWELMAGAFLAIIMRESIFERLVKNHRNLLSLIGILLIALSISLINKSLEFPGYIAATPILGTCLFIAASNHSLIGKILTIRPLVYIGMVSYPFYLWHWPILSFYRIKTAEAPGILTGAVLITLAFVLSVLTYVLIEKRIRFGKKKGIKAILVTSILASIGLIGLTIYRLDGVFDREVNSIAKEYTSITDVYDYFEYPTLLRSNQCHSVTPAQAISSGCISTSRNQIFIWGDSYAAALYNGIKNSIDEYKIDIHVSQMTDGNGPPFYSDKKLTDTHKTLSEANNERLFFVKQYQPKIIVITWMIFGQNSITDKEAAMHGLKETINKIRGASPDSRVVVIGPVPEWNGTLIWQIVTYYSTYRRTPPTYMANGLRPDIKEWDAFLSQNVPKIGVEYLSSYSEMCTHGACLTRTSEGPSGITAVDWGHLTKPGSIFLIDRLKDRLFKP
ncbi:acyltransferase family protein [Aeromonas sp. FDAARGOS 1415]|uniref:acyltransferase family protein n=1 Tax=Aeromonas TaxID=642 RepID=UPI001C2109C0|nr:acyltransferase family protein [Aeromonas sp. FDAARGOS 1415]QXB55501.1 acyltransferase [Aeromonas sp. FDAARGOS 1415]